MEFEYVGDDVILFIFSILKMHSELRGLKILYSFLFVGLMILCIRFF